MGSVDLDLRDKLKDLELTLERAGIPFGEGDSFRDRLLMQLVATMGLPEYPGPYKVGEMKLTREGMRLLYILNGLEALYRTSSEYGELDYDEQRLFHQRIDKARDQVSGSEDE